jgi:hypothetical protein
MPACGVGCIGTVESGVGLAAINDREHLAALHAIPFMSAHLDESAHHLAGENASLGGARRSYRFENIGHVLLLHFYQRNIAHGTGDCLHPFCLVGAGTEQ